MSKVSTLKSGHFPFLPSTHSFQETIFSEHNAALPPKPTLSKDSWTFTTTMQYTGYMVSVRNTGLEH